MYRCANCGATFDEPELIRYCKEEYNGVSDLFGRQTYGTYEACPECESEEIDEVEDIDDEEGFM